MRLGKARTPVREASSPGRSMDADLSLNLDTRVWEKAAASGVGRAARCWVIMDAEARQMVQAWAVKVTWVVPSSLVF